MFLKLDGVDLADELAADTVLCDWEYYKNAG